MRSFIKIAIVAGVIAAVASCGSSEQASNATDTTKKVMIDTDLDTTEYSAISDSVAPTYAEPDSVPTPEEDTARIIR